MKKRVFSVWMIVNLIAFIFQAECSFANEKELEEISRQEAAEAAEDFMTGSEGDLPEHLDKKIVPMYAEDDEVSAYMITFAKGERQRGYAVIDARNNQGQVIEYSYGEDNFIEEAKDKICEDKKEEKSARVYYLGGLSYVMRTKKGKKTAYTEITTSDTKRVSGISETQKDIYYKSEPRNGAIITNPKGYVSGTILSSKVYDVPGSLNKGQTGIRKYKSYTVVGDYSTESNCTPTAATNLLYHWSSLNSSKYGKLKNNTWSNTCNHLYVLMKTNRERGTNQRYVAKAMEIYCKNRGFKCRAATYTDKRKGNAVIEELNHDRPCIFYVDKHATYRNHAMLALGYEKYKYKKGKTTVTDNYIRVADGWDGRSNRFIWGGIDSALNYTSVAISVK